MTTHQFGSTSITLTRTPASLSQYNIKVNYGRDVKDSWAMEQRHVNSGP